MQSSGVVGPESEQVTLIVPSAGCPLRFPGVKPKWMLTQPNCCLMTVDALSALDLTRVHRVVIGTLKKHVNKYCSGNVHSILKAFDDEVPRLQQVEISVVVISDDTVNETRTTECILTAAHVIRPIFLKNCDNQFAYAVKAVDGMSTF
jgi:hypothetical protein